MKIYPKTYKDYYDTEKLGKWCDINLVSADGLDINEYRDKVREVMKTFEASFFDTVVKNHWLSQKFRYNGRSRVVNKRNGLALDGAFGLYLRWYTGYSTQTITANLVYRGMESYLKDFFPDLCERDPFKEKFEYPYKYMTIEQLMLVSRMDERISLLNYGEVKEMGYPAFMNFVLNYVSCLNDEAGKTIYVFISRHSSIGRLPLVVKNKHL